MTQLGFLDEPITEHFKKEVDFTTNKLGGFPDWIDQKNDKKKIVCHVCGSITPLLLQIYAPITERPLHHRTLYIFACVNADCWNNPKSWRCLKDQFPVKEVTKLPSVEHGTAFTLDDWPSSNTGWDCDRDNWADKTSSWGDEASAMMNRVSLDEENGNELPGVAFIESKSSIATAEIEPDEDEPITIDSPVIPNYNLVNLLKAKPSSPKVLNGNVHFLPWFIYATEEKISEDPLSEHVQNLLAEYTKNKENQISLKTMNNVNVVQQSEEKYEKSCPAHGDRLFYSFMSRIKANPEQVMRYCRKNSAPLFLYDTDVPTKCKHCQSNLVFEVQILSTVINHLKLFQENRNQYQHLEFGSVYVYTCEASCDKSEEETVIVQYEKF